jgi:hypothetical protein
VSHDFGEMFAVLREYGYDPETATWADVEALYAKLEAKAAYERAQAELELLRGLNGGAL